MATRTLLQIVQAVADSLSLRVSGTATGGSSTTIVAANYPFKTSDADADTNRYRGTEAYITSSNWTGTPNPNSVVLDAPSTGTLTLGTAHASDTVANGDTFDLYLRGVSIVTIKDCVNHALRNLRYETLIPLTLVTDGDMEASGTSDWTQVGSGSLGKVSSAFNIRGARAMEVVGVGASCTAQSATIRVDPTYQRDWYVSVKVAADVGTARLTAYDVTNSAAIQSEDWTVRGAGILDFQFSLPATCESLAFRLTAVAAGDDTYWEDLIAFPTNMREIPLPSTVIRPDQVIGLVRGYQSVDALYDERLTPDRGFTLTPDPANPNAMFRLRPDRPLHGPTWLWAARGYPTLSADTDTTFCDREWIELAASVELLRRLQNQAPSQEVDAWRNEYRTRRRELNAMNSRLMPRRRLHIVGV